MFHSASRITMYIDIKAPINEFQKKGGPKAAFVEPESGEDLCTRRRKCRHQEVPVFFVLHSTWGEHRKARASFQSLIGFIWIYRCL